MKISITELDWPQFGLWLGIIGGILLVFLAVLLILAYPKK
jgi:hypothetical protein